MEDVKTIDVVRAVVPVPKQLVDQTGTGTDAILWTDLWIGTCPSNDAKIRDT